MLGLTTLAVFCGATFICGIVLGIDFCLKLIRNGKFNDYYYTGDKQ